MIATLTEHKQLDLPLIRLPDQEQRSKGVLKVNFAMKKPSSECREDCGLETETGDSQRK